MGPPRRFNVVHQCRFRPGRLACIFPQFSMRILLTAKRMCDKIPICPRALVFMASLFALCTYPKLVPKLVERLETLVGRPTGCQPKSWLIIRQPVWSGYGEARQYRYNLGTLVQNQLVGIVCESRTRIELSIDGKSSDGFQQQRLRSSAERWLSPICASCAWEIWKA